jgi:hypothetical protein
MIHSLLRNISDGKGLQEKRWGADSDKGKTGEQDQLAALSSNITSDRKESTTPIIEEKAKKKSPRMEPAIFSSLPALNQEEG